MISCYDKLVTGRKGYELYAISIKFLNCRMETLSVWKNLKFVVLERFKSELANGLLLAFLIPLK